MQAFRASVLRFSHDAKVQRIEDALLIVRDGHILELGAYSDLAPRYPSLPIQYWPGKVLAPGFVDIHVHFPQIDIIGSASDGLLEWLNQHTFVAEGRFSEIDHARETAHFFLDELLRQGVTSAMVYGTSHSVGVEAFFEASASRNMRMIAGKCLMDRHCPEAVRDQSQSSIRESEALIERWHENGRLGYAITPRFAPSCSEEQLRGAGELARRYPSVWLQTHLAENRDEVAWALELFPKADHYLDIYDSFGLLRPRSVYAHCIYIDERDRERMIRAKSAAAVCPTSNLFLGSGLFDFQAAHQAGLAYGLASDIGAGTSLSPFRTMLGAFEVARLRGLTLDPATLWYRATWGAAQALDLGNRIGNLQPGMEADFIVLDPQATPLLARRTQNARTLEEWLFAMIVLADDRAIHEVAIQGKCMHLKAKAD